MTDVSEFSTGADLQETSEMVGAELREVIELLKQSTQPPSVDTILAGDDNRTATPAPEPPEATDSWIEQPNHAKWSRLGQMMIERGFVTDEQLEQALVQQRTTGRRVGETFLELGVISSVDLAQVLADHLGVPFVDLAVAPARPPARGADPRSRSPGATARCRSNAGAVSSSSRWRTPTTCSRSTTCGC